MTDSRLIGDTVVDEALERIRMSKRPQGVSTWVGRIAGTRKLTLRITERLWLAGLIRREERPFLFFFKRTVYPQAHSAPRLRLIERLRGVILGNNPVDPRTAALLMCAHGNGVLPQVLERKQLKLHKRQIKAVIDGQPITRELAKALRASVQHYAPVP
jgi:Golgi phosphoprotein 3 (GPP34)